MKIRLILIAIVAVLPLISLGQAHNITRNKEQHTTTTQKKAQAQNVTKPKEPTSEDIFQSACDSIRAKGNCEASLA